MSEMLLSVLERRVEKDLRGMIAESEQGYADTIADLYHAIIADPDKRVILLAGPSSSGKTTTANILADRLREGGHPTFVVSLDDFYRPLDDPDYPRQPNGELDLETVDSLRVEEIRACLFAIAAGQSYWLPRFDFRAHQRIEKASLLSVPRGGYVIFEGLHALNPRLTEGVPAACLFRVFISVAVTLCADDGTRLLTGSKVRFLRRLSRDALYRASGVGRTYRLWKNVLDGESKYLDPFRDLADRRYSTFHTYELGVLKPFVETLLSEADAPRDAYTDSLRAALSQVTEVPVDAVPQNSLLREFIPGGLYEALY